MSTLHQRVKFLSAFLVGAAVTALLCNVSWLRGNYCVGDGCATVVEDTEPHFRRLLSFFTGKSGNTTSQLPLMPQTSGNASDPAINTSNVVLLSEEQSSSHEQSRPKLTTPFTTTSSSSSSSLLYVSQSKQQLLVPTLPHSRRTYPTPSTSDADQLISMVNRISLKCHTQNCQELLTTPEKTNFNDCFEKCSKQKSKFGDIKNGTCRFMNGHGRLPVALASFPGSGNTWARGLIEKVTGICTGGLYCDCGLRTGGFTGEGVKGSSVMVMKTHNRNPQFVGGHVISADRLPYGSAILLVRDPRRALIAEWNRERSKRQVSETVSNHFTYVGPEYFGYNKDWDAYIHKKIDRWPFIILNLLVEAKMAKRPVLILRYEDLKENTTQEMKRVTDFLGFSYSVDEVAARLEDGYSQFYRNHTVDFLHFTPTQELFLHNMINSTSQLMKQYDIFSLFPHINDYL